ncbi:MAG: ComEC/Rec2 family competence protein [Candidatus Moraniibacteriota bacterium]|nr:MAG: ComEC/Rec2 family competence protein [Candidatus Moranbacteria bacterium]
MDWKRIFASRGPVLFCYDYNPRKTGERTITWQSRLADMRSDWESRLEKILPFPESALGSGLLFGGTSRFSKEWEEKFNNTSMTHIVAVSGYNVTLLVQYFSLIAIAIGIRRQHSWWIGVLGIFFFLALIGFPASGVRAGIMGILVLFAVRGGVIGSGTRALLLASAMMVFDNPFILRYDVGFQLSVLATAGILLGVPIIVTKWNKQKFPWIVEIFIEIFLTTLAAQLFVLPLILGTFGSFSFLSLFANILILWNIPLVMFFLFFALVVSSFSFFLAKLFGLGASLILSYNLFVIDSISSFSFFSISSFSMDFSYMYYGAILFVLFWYYVKNRRKKYLQCELYEAGEK